MKPTEMQFKNFQLLFDYFNTNLFSGTLPNVILQFSRKGKTIGGFFAPDRWEPQIDFDGADFVHEISLNPESFIRDPKEVMAILVHEMVHLWQAVYGTAPRSGYHDKEWGQMMEAVGLMPSNSGHPGGRRTGQQMFHYIIPDGRYERAWDTLPKELLLPFIHVLIPVKESKSRSKTKFSCSCGNNIWGKGVLRITCNDCGQDYKPEIKVNPCQDG